MTESKIIKASIRTMTEKASAKLDELYVLSEQMEAVQKALNEHIAALDELHETFGTGVVVEHPPTIDLGVRDHCFGFWGPRLAFASNTPIKPSEIFEKYRYPGAVKNELLTAHKEEQKLTMESVDVTAAGVKHNGIDVLHKCIDIAFADLGDSVVSEANKDGIHLNSLSKMEALQILVKYTDLLDGRTKGERI